MPITVQPRKSNRAPVIYIETKKQALAALDHASKMDIVAVDSEFNEDKSIEIWSYSSRAGERYVVEAEFLTSVYADWLQDRKIKKVYVHYRADAEVFERIGLNMDRSFYADVMVMDWCCDENDPRHGLKWMSRKWLNWKRKEYSEQFFYIPDGKKKPLMLWPKQMMRGDLPDEALLEYSKEQWKQRFIDYAGDDAESTIRLFDHHRERLIKEKYWDTYLKIDRPFTITLKRMQKRGIKLNLGRLEEILREVEITMMRYEHCFKHECGNLDINLRSNPQLQKLFFEELQWPKRADFVTEAGNPQISAEALHWYAEEHGFLLAKHLLGHKSVSTLKGTFLEGLLEGVSEDGRLRSDFNQIGADTGRISSRKGESVRITEHVHKKTGVVRYTKKKIKVGANLQNIPSRKEKDPYGIRGAFIAAEGRKLIVADYSGFELCMAVHFASKYVENSKMLKAMIKYGTPSALHALTAIEFNSLPIPMDDWKRVKAEFPDLYKDAKNCNFNLLYGGMEEMLCRILGWDYRDKRMLDKAGKLIRNWNRIYPEIGTYQRKQKEMGHNLGFVKTISGRRVHVGDGLSSVGHNGREDMKMRSYWERKCMNTPCQGSAADIVKVAMNLVERDEELKDYKAELLYPVHDELVVEAPEKYATKAMDRVVALMKLPFRDQMKFELSVEANVADNWQDAK